MYLWQEKARSSTAWLVAWCSQVLWRWMEHAGWMVFEDVIRAGVSAKHSRRQLKDIAGKSAELEVNQHLIEEKVRARTAELQAKKEELHDAKDKAEASNRSKKYVFGDR